jgi:transcriptional regulator with XRE-family HTH domain
MTDQSTLDAPVGVTLGRYLSAIRADRRLSLRQVEEATGREVSNAYLSQVENDKIKEPSPRILHALAKLYAIDYASLMEKAGYISPSTSEETDNYARGAAFADMNLAPEEEAELLTYLQFMRSKKPKQ